MAGPRKFDVKAILTDPVDASTAILYAGDQSFETQIPENSTEFSFPPIDLEKGPLELKVVLGDNEEQGPYQVVISQNNSQ